MGAPVIFQGEFSRSLSVGGLLLTDGTLLNSNGAYNFVPNGSFEKILTEWSQYADAPGTSPVDGVGGTGFVTIERVELPSFAGLAFGRVMKDAANRQGHGVSVPVSIIGSYQSRELEITFDYLTSSDYASGDLGIYLEDVTSGELIPLSANEIPASASIVGFRATFTASTNLDYLLLIHCRSTNGLIYALDFDDLKLSLPSTAGSSGSSSSNKSIEGGAAATVFLVSQNIDGGNASSTYTPSQVINGGGA